jgi:hypothetical protein
MPRNLSRQNFAHVIIFFQDPIKNLQYIQLQTMMSLQASEEAPKKP